MPGYAEACQLYALKRALEILALERGTVYADSEYAFGVVHTFGKTWEKRALLNSKGKGLVHENLISEVLEVLQLPKEIAVLHIPDHQKGTTLEIWGNNLADLAAKSAAESGEESIIMVLTPTEEIQDIPIFSETEERKFLEIGVKKNNKGKWVLSDGRQLLNKLLARKILESIHNKTHWGTQALSDQFEKLQLHGSFWNSQANNQEMYNMRKT